MATALPSALVGLPGEVCSMWSPVVRTLTRLARAPGFVLRRRSLTGTPGLWPVWGWEEEEADVEEGGAEGRYQSSTEAYGSK